MKLKGENKSANFLLNNGFSRSKAFHLIGKDVKIISLSDVRKLCNVFNCTPNDLFTISESEAASLPPNSALKKLVRMPVYSMPELVGDLSVEQATELMNKIREMKNQT